MIDARAAALVAGLLAGTWFTLAAATLTPATPCTGGGSDPVRPSRRRRHADDPTARALLGLHYWCSR